MKVPMPKTKSLHTDILADHKNDEKLKMVCLENTDSTLKSYASSEIDVSSNALEIRNHSSSELNSKAVNKTCHVSKIKQRKKSSISSTIKDIKPGCGTPFPIKSTLYNKPMKHSLPKRKLQPVVSHLSNNSAKVVLFERNVEIKDLESKVKYLNSQIQKLENENKILRNIQSRLERELKMFKEGVTDIPSLLKSHKEEIKMYETTISNIRRELRDCQKDLKNKTEVLLKKENHIRKLNVSLKQYEKRIQETSCKQKDPKDEKMHMQDEYKILLDASENLKSLNEDQQKKIENMTQQIQSLEESLIAERDEKRQLKDDMQALRKRFEDLELKVPFKGKISPGSASCLQKENSCCVLLDDVSSKINQDSELFTAEITKNTQENGLFSNKSNEDFILVLKQHCKELNGPKFGEECSFKDNKTSYENLKLLPPLKKSCKKYSQNTSKNHFDKECCSSSSLYETKSRDNQW